MELAADAASEVGGAAVGAHVDVRAEADRVVTHRFEANLPGYAGWYWAVTVARVPRAKLVTVDEVVLLPGETALRAPEWLPWSERLRPGDLAPGDVLPTTSEDARLMPGFYASGDDSADEPAVAAVAAELFLGRPSVLSSYGRDEAAERWSEGEHGPDSPMAIAAPGTCASCGFLVALAGAMRGSFGVCANQYAPADGQVVTVDYGCGAHSDAVVGGSGEWAAAHAVYDDAAIDVTTS